MTIKGINLFSWFCRTRPNFLYMESHWPFTSWLKNLLFLFSMNRQIYMWQWPTAYQHSFSMVAQERKVVVAMWNGVWVMETAVSKTIFGVENELRLGWVWLWNGCGWDSVGGSSRASSGGRRLGLSTLDFWKKIFIIRLLKCKI